MSHMWGTSGLAGYGIEFGSLRTLLKPYGFKRVSALLLNAGSQYQCCKRVAALASITQHRKHPSISLKFTSVTALEVQSSVEAFSYPVECPLVPRIGR